MAGPLLDLRPRMLSEYAGRLEDGCLSHYLAEPCKAVYMVIVMDFDHTMVNLILESDQVVLRRRIAVEPVESHRVEKASSLVA